MTRFRNIFAAVGLALACAPAQALVPTVYGEGFQPVHHRMMAPCRTSYPLDGTHLAVGRGPLLVVLDVSVPEAPRVVSETSLSGTILDMVRFGNMLYVAAGKTGVRIVNISDLARPKEVSVYTKGFTNAVAIHPNGRILYATVGDSIIEIIRVEDPFYPKSKGQMSLPGGFFQDLLCSGNILLAASGPKGVYAFSLESPTVPKKLSGFKVLESADHLELNGRLLAVAGTDAFGRQGVALVNYPTWDAPNQKGFLDMGSQVLDLAVVPTDPTKALLALGDEGYAVADLSVPEFPVILFRGESPLPVVAADAALNGPRLFLSSAYNGLWQADFSEGPAPSITKMMEANVVARTVASKGNTVYMSTEERNLEVWDYSDPLAPEMVTVLETPRAAQHLLAKGDLLVASCETDGFFIFDISVPLNPIFLSSMNPHTGGTGATFCSDIWGNLLAIGGGTDGLRIYDISDPSAPAPVDQGAWNFKTGYVRGVVFEKANIVWCTQSVLGLVALQLHAAGTAPTELGHGSLSYVVTGQFVLTETHAYASTEVGCDVLDITNYAKPDNQKTLGGNQVFYSGVWDNHLYISRGIYGLEEWDMTSPPQLFQTRVFNTPGQAAALTRLENGTFVMVDGEGGAWAMDLSDCPGPILRLPCDGDVVPFQTITFFSWDPGAGALFRAEISDDPYFSKGSKTLGSGEDLLKYPNWSPFIQKWKKLLKWGRGKTLYWRVNLFDEKGNKIGVSETRSFGLS